MAQKKTIVIEAKDNTRAAFNKVNKNLNTMDKTVKKTSSSMNALKTGIKGALAALSVGVLIRATKGTLEYADALGKTSARLGMTTKSLQTLRFAATQSGMTTEALEMSMQRFTRRLAEANQGTGVLKETFNKLGMSLVDSNGKMKSAETMLGEVADKLAAIPDQGEKVRLAFAMFDSEGVKMVNMLQGGAKGLDEMRDKLESTGAFLGKDFIADAEAANDAIDLLTNQIKAGFGKSLVAVAPFISKFTDMIQDLMKAADRHPVIKTLTAAIIGLSTALALMTVAGGPVSLAIVGIGALTIAAVEMHSAFKKTSKPFKEMGLEELNKVLINNRMEIDRLTIAWGKAKKKGSGGLFDFGGETQELLKNIAQAEHRVKVAEKYVNLIKDQQKAQALLKQKAGLDAEVALREKNLAIGQQAKKDLIAIIALEEAKKKALAIHAEIKAHDKYVKDRIANEKKITLNHALESLERTKLANIASQELLESNKEFGDTEMQALQDQHDRRNELIHASYDLEGNYHGKWMQRKHMEEERFHKAVMDLNIARTAGILSMYSALGKELWSQGLLGFDAMRAIAIAEATINAHVAATKAMASLPPPWSFAAAAVAYASAMAQVYKIGHMNPSGREHGGPVTAGTSYMVGERGPEMFTPNQTGSITPNDQMGGSNVTFNILANDTRGFDQLLQQRRGMIVSMLNNHMSSNGLPSIETVGRMATSYAQR